MPFTVACLQIAPDKAKVSANLDRIAEAIRTASMEGADLVVLPETSTTGYFLEGGVLESSLTAEQLQEELDRRLRGLAREFDCIIGFYEQSGGNLYNSCAYYEFAPKRATVVKAVYRKFFLPTYGFFDEERFVSRGRDMAVFDTRFGRFGILICEDAWHSILPTLCAVRGAQMIVVPAASPARGFASDPDDPLRTSPQNLDRYVRLMVAIAEEHGIYTVNCQLCGFEGGKGFIGGSMVVDPFGKVVGQGPVNEEYILLAEVDLDLVQIARAQTPLISDLQSAWGDIRRMVDEG